MRPQHHWETRKPSLFGYPSFLYPPPFHNTRLWLSFSSKSSSSDNNNNNWTIGDTVLVDVHKDGSNLVQGVIQDIRKGGWYTLKLSSADGGEQNQQVKVRKSQLTTATTATSTKLESDTTTEKELLLQQLPLEEPVQAIPAMTVTIASSDDSSTATTASKMTADIDNSSTTNNNPPPPPPRMDDLDALLQASDKIKAKEDPFLQQLAHHASIAKWVVFTDLHVAPSTLETSLAVIHRVHELAQQRHAGVLFLGDFWHHRGTLRVDCLNAVLHAFRQWTVPMILIPGNHDQVTLGGHSHGLTPLEQSYRVVVDHDDSSSGTTIPGPLVFSHPTKLGNALFVPHIRDLAIMESVLQSDMAQSCQALFVHADVTGAYMNDMIVSTGGVHPSVFPSNRPIYSGHFHKPHTVIHNKNKKTADTQEVCIEYLGSPYETSLAEAHQEKALVVLDATQGWKCIERIPMNDIGRKHFKPQSVDELLELHVPTMENNVKTATKKTVKEGDRIVLTLPRREVRDLDENTLFQDHTRALRQAGVAVEIREATTTAEAQEGDPASVAETAGATSLEDLSPLSTWARFWEVQQGADYDEEEAMALQEAGLRLLEEMEESDGATSSSTKSTEGSLLATKTNLQLDSVAVEGYGPFPTRVDYPLNDRGLVLLKGTNLDGGSDSNGSGKTTLAMAALWAMTGSADPRPFQDSKVVDILNDSNQNARVSVTGHLNGKPFVITRTKTPKKTGLAFFLDGQDLTTQSAKETMAVIEEKLGVSAPILARTMFHGQHALNELLEATDAKLKEELSLIVPLELWQGAGTLARSKGRTATKKENELQGMLALRTDDMEKLQNRYNRADADLKDKEEILCAREAEAESFSAKQQDDDGGDEATKGKSLDSLRGSLEEANSSVETHQNHVSHLKEGRASVLKDIDGSLRIQMQSAQTAAEQLQKAQLEHQSANYEVETLKGAIDKLEKTWQVDLSVGELPSAFNIPEICPTCQQPVTNNGHEHAHESLQEKAEDEIQATLHSLATAQTKLLGAREAVEDAELGRQKLQAEVQIVHEQRDEQATYWDKLVYDAEEALRSSREQVAHLTQSYTAQAERQQEAALAQSKLEAQLNTARQAVEFAKEAHGNLSGELETLKAAVEDLGAQAKEQRRLTKQCAGLSDAFGTRGIQTFVLQNAVRDLQCLSQKYLDDFSDGAQRLQMSLDAGDKISRRALVREPDGSFRERPLATLSGGQWRRCSLALTLGFADLVATRGRLRPSLIVLDEPLTHLDRAGRRDVGKVLQKILGQRDGAGSGGSYSNFATSTILLILQDLAAEELEEAFDCIDEVVKKNGASFVKVDESTS
ncbi:expressed unknown protein [Seminavis robusta]|uniref:Calcineurin-like phosphoesterase domain-containing protein n=1 Tax=Seminavis robusta TaxID=568900 RepID=A0A9N8DMY9_9STRA|nr:expressed unknown protein [Seminavis robusta]|eukprot:Sro234_g094430.1 n/a (1337) ;mRNA; r:37688-41904